MTAPVQVQTEVTHDALVINPTLLHSLVLFPQPRLAPAALNRLLCWTYPIPVLVGWLAAPSALLPTATASRPS